MSTMRTRILIVGTLFCVGGTVAAVAVAPAKKAPQPAKPQVATSAATNLADTSATLNGTVNPKSSATSFRFDYGKTNTYGSTTGLVGVGSGNTNVPVPANLPGLTPNTTYHFRLVANNANGTSMTGDRSFTT